MYFDYNLGIFGNIEKLFKENQHRSNEIYNETNKRIENDSLNREAVEQRITDAYLDGVEAQQQITDLQLQILELKN